MKLAIGTAQFGEDYGISNNRRGIPDYELKEIFNICKYQKINIFDSAVSYKNSLNKIKRNLKKEKEFEIICKILVKNINTKVELLNVVNKAIDKLKGLKVSILVHDSNQFLLKNANKKNIIIELLSKMQKEKKIFRYGFSVYSLSEALSLMNKYEFKILQIPINLFNQSFIDKKFIDLVKIKKIELHARSVFLQGLIFLDKKIIKKKFGKLPKQIDNFFNEFVSKEKKIYESINFIKQLSFIKKILVGISSKDELNQIIKIYKSRSKNIKNFKKYKVVKKKFINPYLWPKENVSK